MENSMMYFIGIDVGKNSRVAGLVSSQLLEKHGRFDRCPAFSFENNRIGFELFLSQVKKNAPLHEVSVLLESTGHYHRALLEYLLERNVAVYMIHVMKRPKGSKSDKRDALNLAN